MATFPSPCPTTDNMIIAQTNTKYNTLTQSIYNLIVNSLDINNIKCTYCNNSNFHYHGYYNRNILINNKRKPLKLLESNVRVVIKPILFFVILLFLLYLLFMMILSLLYVILIYLTLIYLTSIILLIKLRFYIFLMIICVNSFLEIIIYILFPHDFLYFLYISSYIFFIKKGIW